MQAEQKNVAGRTLDLREPFSIEAPGAPAGS
jgi:hypothetical protein